MKYHNITKDDMLNGDGLRVVLWVSGCSHKCPGCHNSITWDENVGLDFDESAKNELFAELQKDYVSGITFSGGDPLFHSNRQCVSNLISEISEKFSDKTIWLYTGYTWDAIKDLDFIKKVDVLVDGRFEEANKDVNLHWKGSSNQRVINVKSTLQNGSIVLH